MECRVKHVSESIPAIPMRASTYILSIFLALLSLDPLVVANFWKTRL